MKEINRKRILDYELNDCKIMLLKYKMLLKDFTENYLPMRDKCLNFIRKHGLDHYSISDVLRVSYSPSNVFENHKHTQIRFTIYDVENKDYWQDGKVRWFAGHPWCPALLEEDINLDACELLDNTPEIIDGYLYWNSTQFNRVLISMGMLEDITKFFTDMVETLEQKINEINNRRNT